jgi:hypothetical protein
VRPGASSAETRILPDHKFDFARQNIKPVGRWGLTTSTHFASLQCAYLSDAMGWG